MPPHNHKDCDACNPQADADLVVREPRENRLGWEQRGVRTSQGCQEAVIENLASNLMKRREKNEIMERYYDFQKAYDNVNHSFLEELLNVHGFPIGVQMLIIEMTYRWRIPLSYGVKKDVGEGSLENGIITGDAFFLLCLF